MIARACAYELYALFVCFRFANYDEQYPITGELYAASPNDKEFHSSSIVKVEKRPEMVTFHWGDAGMLGTMPDMTKGDDC